MCGVAVRFFFSFNFLCDLDRATECFYLGSFSDALTLPYIREKRESDQLFSLHAMGGYMKFLASVLKSVPNGFQGQAGFLCTGGRKPSSPLW